MYVCIFIYIYRIAARSEGSRGRPLVTSPDCLDWANSDNTQGGEQTRM